ncbi:hypothetical protein [Nodularia chucula]|uniref:hypothetical protein n=1 Tax=Nodularia chucula TaxID=3093667 RepID=UPI0039C6009A
MFEQVLTLRKTIEIELEVVINLNQIQRDPTTFGINKSEEDFSVNDLEKYEECLAEEATKIAQKIVDDRLLLIKNHVETKAAIYVSEGYTHELIHINNCKVETNHSDWDIVGENSNFVD